AGPAEDPDVLGPKADLLHQLPVHRLFRRFARLDPALRELPGVLFDTLAPEHFVAGVDEYDPDVWAISIAIDHDRHQQKLASGRFFHKADMYANTTVGRAAACVDDSTRGSAEAGLCPNNVSARLRESWPTLSYARGVQGKRVTRNAEWDFERRKTS